MKINVKTGDFILTKEKNNPIVLMVFNLFENNVDNVIFEFDGNKVNFKYKSGNLISIDIEDSNLKEILKTTKKIMIIEIDEEDGDIKDIYTTKKKPT